MKILDALGESMGLTGQVTLSRAAEMAGLRTWNLLARMGEECLHYDMAEFEADLAALPSRS